MIYAAHSNWLDTKKNCFFVDTSKNYFDFTIRLYADVHQTQPFFTLSICEAPDGYTYAWQGLQLDSRLFQRGRL